MMYRFSELVFSCQRMKTSLDGEGSDYSSREYASEGPNQNEFILHVDQFAPLIASFLRRGRIARDLFS